MIHIETAQKYFKYSNDSNFDKISELFCDTSTYSSQNTGLYLGRKEIIKMQQVFHKSFEKLHWKVVDIIEEKPWIVKIDFEFTGIKLWEKISFSAIEYIVILDGVIQHIEIRNK